MDDFYKLLAVLILTFALFLIYVQYRRILNLLQNLGAKITSYIPLRANFKVENRDFKISTLGRGILTISTISPVSGYLSIEKKLIHKGFNIFYDDEDWAQMVLKSSRIMPLIEGSKIRSLEINGNTLKLTLYKGKLDKQLEENIKNSVDLLLDVAKSLEGLPSSPIGSEKNKLRNWIIYYIPAGIFFFLFVLGIYWMMKGYNDPLCEGDLFTLGFKMLTPVFLFHFLLCMLILGRHFHPKAHVLPLVFLYFAGYYLIPLFILNPFNARFDRSEPKMVETRILNKYRAYKGGFRLVLELTGCSLRVSERLYKKSEIGDVLVLYVKDGAFGVKWAYRYWLKD